MKSKLDEFARNNLVDNKTTRPNIKSVARLAKKPRTPRTLKNKPKTASGGFKGGKIGSSGRKKKNHKSIQKKDNKEKDTLHEISWSVSFMSIL